eukprot:NODE_14164_length_1125_cov_2.415832.p1 GENE.NODE_14164_length_1125_cov_2.415832~~NODE_14164_length_1125_cov_2.415832.p1  ORF type:complete len:280 (+),score=76.77 NODE_14164_length_1125_cov_2.415832:102-941(+)
MKILSLRVQQAMGMGPQYMAFTGVPDPFAVLAQIGRLKITEKVAWQEVIIGFEVPNKYIMSDADAHTNLFIAAERGEGVMGMVGRQALSGGSRPFNIDIALLIGPGAAPMGFVRLERPFKCTCCCFGRPEVQIFNSITNAKIGMLYHPFACCHMSFILRDGNDNDVLRIKHNCCDCSICCWGCPCGCQETDFEVDDVSSGETIAHIKRKFRMDQALGMVAGVSVDADTYVLELQQVANPEWKAMLIGAALFLDYSYFTKGGPQQRQDSLAGQMLEPRGD